MNSTTQSTSPPLSEPAGSEHFSIHQWPADERPRERLLANGASRLSDAELLALLLGTGTRGRSAVDCARRWLALGELREALSRPLHELPRDLGVGPAKWATVQAALELGRRLETASLRRGRALRTPGDAQGALRAHLAGLDHEVFAAIFLDARHRVLAQENLFRGGVSHASVYVGEVVKRALTMRASAMIVAHNHPTGIAEPSDSDIDLTQRLRAALALVDVRLLDHVIVGANDPFSFAENGLL